MGYQEMLRKFIETKFEKLAAKKTNVVYDPKTGEMYIDGRRMDPETAYKALLETPDRWDGVLVIKSDKPVQSMQKVLQVGDDPNKTQYIFIYGTPRNNKVYVTFGQSLEELNNKLKVMKQYLTDPRVSLKIDPKKIETANLAGVEELRDFSKIVGTFSNLGTSTKTGNNQTNTGTGTDEEKKTVTKTKTDQNNIGTGTDEEKKTVTKTKTDQNNIGTGPNTGTNQTINPSPGGQSNSSAKITPLQAGLIAGAAALPAAFIISEAIREKKRQERDKQLREVLNPSMIYHIAKNASDRRFEKFAARVQAATVAPGTATSASPTSTVPTTAAGASIVDLIVASLAFSPLLLLIRPREAPEARSSAIYYSVINSPVHPALKKRADEQKKDEKENQPKQLDAAIWVPLAAAGGTLASVLASKFVTEPRAKKEITVRPADPVQDAYFNPYGLGNYYLRQYEKARKARKEMLKDVYESYRSRED